MKKIIVFSPDPLFGAKICRELIGHGVAAIMTSDPIKLENYLNSGEINLLICDGPWSLQEWQKHVDSWTKYKGLKCILSADPLPEALPAAAEAAGIDFRLVEKQFLSSLILDILAEFIPDFISSGSLEKTVNTRERRKSARIDKSLRLFIKNVQAKTTEEVTGRTSNVSPMGAKIITHTPLGEAGLTVKMLLPYFSEIIPFKARVIWSRPANEEGNHVSGIFFDHMADADRFALKNFLSASGS